MISLCFQEIDALVSGTEPLLASEQNQTEHSLLYLHCLNADFLKKHHTPFSRDQFSPSRASSFN